MEHEEDADSWRRQYHNLRDSLVRFYTTAAGTRWQVCRVCRASDAAVRILTHDDDCPLACRPPAGAERDALDGEG